MLRMPRRCTQQLQQAHHTSGSPLHSALARPPTPSQAAPASLHLQVLCRLTSPLLREVELPRCFRLTDAALQHLAATCPRLERLLLQGIPRITDAGIAALLASPCVLHGRLHTLGISPALGGITAAGAARLLEPGAVPGLRKLLLAEARFAEDEDEEAETAGAAAGGAGTAAGRAGAAARPAGLAAAAAAIAGYPEPGAAPAAAVPVPVPVPRGAWGMLLCALWEWKHTPVDAEDSDTDGAAAACNAAGDASVAALSRAGPAGAASAAFTAAAGLASAASTAAAGLASPLRKEYGRGGRSSPLRVAVPMTGGGHEIRSLRSLRTASASFSGSGSASVSAALPSPLRPALPLPPDGGSGSAAAAAPDAAGFAALPPPAVAAAVAAPLAAAVSRASSVGSVASVDGPDVRETATPLLAARASTAALAHALVPVQVKQSSSLLLLLTSPFGLNDAVAEAFLAWAQHWRAQRSPAEPSPHPEAGTAASVAATATAPAAATRSVTLQVRGESGLSPAVLARLVAAFA